jgi:two-component system cell cycle response regulator CpdR
MPRILVVDDETAIRGLLESAFSEAGYDVRGAADALEAMALCTKEHFDMVLSDVVMPGMDGHELVQWLAKTFPGIPCALMTGFEAECKDCPFDPPCPLLRKPFPPKEAVALVTRILNAPPG